jgi:hypothetical protein
MIRRRFTPLDRLRMRLRLRRISPVSIRPTEGQPTSLNPMDGTPARTPVRSAPASPPASPTAAATATAGAVPSLARFLPAHMPRATQQMLDPLGTLAASPLTPVLAGIVLLYALISTAMHADQITDPGAAVLAVIAVAAAGAVLVVAASPARSPFQGRWHIAVVVLAVAALALEQVSTWGKNELIQDDFGLLAIGLFLLALAPYRPGGEIAVSATLAAVVVGLLAYGQAGFLSVIVPPGIYVIVAVTQVLAPALSGAAYSRRVVKSIQAWQADARRAIVTRTEEDRELIELSVVEQRVSQLRVDVLPFLHDLLEAGQLSDADVARAGALADAVRRSLVAEINATWLDAAVARERARLVALGVAPLLVVADPEHRAEEFTADQRAATAALISALCAAPGFDPGSLVVQVTDLVRPDPTRPGPGHTVTIQAGLAQNNRAIRALLRPYLGVLRTVFVRVRLTRRQALLTLEFDDQRPASGPVQGPLSRSASKKVAR